MNESTSKPALHVESRGRKDRPALLLLHGLLSSNLQWELQRPAFDDAFRWHAAELWGHGGSPAPIDPPAYSADGYVGAFEALRRALGLERWIVVGQSLGAGLMLRYALDHPEAVRGIVLTNSLSAFSEVGSALHSPTLEDVRALDLRTLPVHPTHAKRFPQDLRDRMARAADGVDRVALWRAFAETLRSTCCRDQLPKLAVPALLVNGARERAFQPHRDFAAGAMPGLRVVDLEAGHAVNIEAPQEFEAAVLGFTASLADG
ncbi:MAG TPA: alpha/beta hydrolase [Myxococcota bacterium]|nr:alpha/beta hydrolase [Myxococcota bacterium]